VSDIEYEGRKPFAAFIQEQRNGGLHGELSHELAALVTAVQETQKPGTLTLTIKVQPNKDGVTMTVTDKVVAKAPEAERGAAVFFIQGDGNLVRSDPRQLKMSLREVEKPDAGLREIDAAAE
jgi:hypothetical protein